MMNGKLKVITSQQIYYLYSNRLASRLECLFFIASFAKTQQLSD